VAKLKLKLKKSRRSGLVNVDVGRLREDKVREELELLLSNRFYSLQDEAMGIEAQWNAVQNKLPTKVLELCGKKARKKTEVHRMVETKKKVQSTSEGLLQEATRAR